MRRIVVGTSSGVTYCGLQFSVLRVESACDWLPAYSIVQRTGRVSLKFSWWDGPLLSVAWPEQLKLELSFERQPLAPQASFAFWVFSCRVDCR